MQLEQIRIAALITVVVLSFRTLCLIRTLLLVFVLVLLTLLIRVVVFLVLRLLCYDVTRVIIDVLFDGSKIVTGLLRLSSANGRVSEGTLSLVRCQIDRHLVVHGCHLLVGARSRIPLSLSFGSTIATRSRLGSCFLD